MAPCCVGSSVKEFTVLLIHVLHVSHPSALEGSTRYARELVDRFFRNHTRIDISHIDSHNYKFRNLTDDSRLEIAFVGRPRSFKVPNHKVYKYEHSEGLAVIFEVETRIVKRYIAPHSDSDIVEIERTDYVPLTGCIQRHVYEYVNVYEKGK
jgi:hypothetical protein